MNLKKIAMIAVLLAIMMSLQAAELAGRVTDADIGAPLSGVNITIAGTDLGEASERDGSFHFFNLPAGKVEVEFSYVGYKTLRKQITLSEDKPTHFHAALHPSAVGIGVITVTARRSASETRLMPINVVGSELLETRNVTRMDNVFANQSGLAVSSTGPGIVRPVIRGMYESQVLVLWDGVPMLDLRPGGNHVLLLEPEQIQRVEVARGPGSVLYGSNAVGGIVNFITVGANPFTGKRIGVSANAGGGYGTLGNLMRGKANMAAGNSNVTVGLNFGYKKSGNYSDPSGEIPNSAYEGYHVDGHAGVNLKAYQGDFSYHLLNADVGVPLNPAIRYSAFEDERQQFAKMGNQIDMPWDFFPEIKLDLSWQRHNRHFHLIKPFDANPDTFEQDMQVFVEADGYYGSLLPTFKIGDYSILRAGVDFTLQKATSERVSFTTNLFDGSQNQLSPPRVFPDAQRTDIGFMFEDETDIGLLTILAGVRYDMVNSRSFETENSSIEPSQDSDAALSGNLGLITHLPAGITVPIHVARAFRSPTILERYFWGPHQETVDRGNPDLIPETSLNLDAGINQSIGMLRWSICGFCNTVSDFIYKELTDEYEGGMQVATWRNVGSARFAGGEAEVTVFPVKNLGISAGTSYVQADDVDADQPLGNIPPLNGFASTRYANEVFHTELVMSWAAKQARLGLGETETPGYAVFDLNAGINFARWIPVDLRLNLSAHNLLDTEYYNHLSRTKQWYAEPGRSMSLSVQTGI